MPEYNNKDITDPAVTVLFRFENEEDFDEFHRIIKEILFDGDRVFDGMQRKTEKYVWWPPKEKASNFRYRDES